MSRPPPEFDLLSRAELGRRRTQLLARIRRKYNTLTESLYFGPLNLEFVRVEDPNVVLDQIVIAEDRLEKLTGKRRDGDELHLPYWAELWDSAFGIAQHLVRVRPARKVIDLGCGMGLAGTVAAAMGANVLLADLEPDALLFARLNTLAYSSRSCVRRLNWQTETLDEKFDLILGADVLYDRKQWESLDRFWTAHLNAGGAILLGEPGRQTGDLFIDWIASRGWRLDRAQERVESRAKTIRLLRLTK